MPLKVSAIAFAAVAALAARLWFAYAYHGNFDQDSYQIVAGIMEKGGNVYNETSRYNYSPFWFHCLLLLSKIGNFTGWPFHFVVRGALSLVDMANGLMIGAVAAQIGLSRYKSTLLYWLNPIAIIIVGFHGQFETLAMTPLLAATYLWLRKEGPPNVLWIWALGTLALVIKHNTVFAVWTLFLFVTSITRATLMLGFAVLIFLASFLPYVAGGSAGIVNHVFRYNGGILGEYGFGDLLPINLWKPFFYGLNMLIPLAARYWLRVSLPQAVTLSFIALIALVHGIGGQWFLMPLLWASMFSGGWYFAYTLVVFVFLLGNRDHFQIAQVPALWNSIWIVVMGWLISYFTSPKARRDVDVSPAAVRQ